MVSSHGEPVTDEVPEERAMSKPVQSNAPSSDNASHVAVLQADLVSAREQLTRVASEYETMLSDDGTIQEDRDSTAQLLAEARAAVSRLETALARAEAGTYGQCERCGAKIPEERLAVLPDASTCVSCA
jgi:DnaK suppressor protein